MRCLSGEQAIFAEKAKKFRFTNSYKENNQFEYFTHA
jgi:hypothetical protein